MGQTHGRKSDGSSAYVGRKTGPDDHEAEAQAVQSALEAFQERTSGQVANIDTPDEGDPQPWHESFASREGLGGMLDDLPATEGGDPTDSQEALSDSYDQFFDRMDEMSAAASETAEAQSEALRQSQEQREAARPYDNDDIRRDKTGVPGTDRGRRNAEEQRIRRGSDVAGPHSVPWEQHGEGPPQNRTLQQQESIEADAAELNDISEQAHQGIDHSERAAAVRTASSDRTAPADTVLDSITLENSRDGSGYEVPVDADSEWSSALAESHDQDTVNEVTALSQQITDAFPKNAAEADLDPAQFTAGPSQESVAQGISTLVNEEGQSPQEAAFNVVDTLKYDEQTRHALDESALDPRDALDETQQQRAQSATQDLQETYPDFADRDTDEIEQTVARKMAAGADVISARDGAVRDAAEDDTFTWPIEELDVESQHRVSVEGNIEELYDPRDTGQHQAGILKDTDGPQTKENHMKFTWFKNSGIDGKVSDLAGKEGVPEEDGEVDISGSRDYLREGDRVRFVRGTVDRWKDQKQLTIRGVTEIQILEEGDGRVVYEGIGEPTETASTPQDLDAVSTDREEIDPGDFDDTGSYMDALAPAPEERRPDAADSVTAARDVVSASDAPADLGARDGVTRVENDGETQFEITTERRGDTSSNPWRAQQQRERRREGRRQRQYDEQSEEYRRRSLQRWDVPDDAVDQIIEQERQEQAEREIAQSMSYQRSESETMYGYDSTQVHLDLPTDSERRREE